MMDESPLGAMNLGSIAVKDEKTDGTTFKNDWHKLIEEEHVENCLQPLENEVEKVDPPFVFVQAEDNKSFVIVTQKNREIPSPAEERHAHYTLPPPLYFKSFIRKKVRQEEIVFNRECKKLEKVWTNRGLPVDKETVCAAASKDAFDLKDLSESLPSTSTSVNKPSIVEIGSWCQLLKPCMPIEFDRFPRRRRLPNEEKTHTFRRTFTHSWRRELSERMSSACNSQTETVQERRLWSLATAQKLIQFKRHIHSYTKNFLPLLYPEKPDCDEQKEASGDSLHSRLKKVFSNLTHTCPKHSQNPCSSTSEQPNFGEEFAKMSIDDKQNEKKKETQDSDDENYLRSPVLNPLSVTLPYVPKLEVASSWDSNKHWNTKFHWIPKKLEQMEQECYQVEQELSDPPAPVPLNSPIKKEGNTGNLLFSLEMAEMRLRALKHTRDEKKLKTLNSLRGISPGDVDCSESEKPFLDEAATVFYQKSPKVDSSTQTEKISVDKMKELLKMKELFKEQRQRLRKMEESLKSYRTLRVPFAQRHIVKSDKVVPD